MIKIENIIKIGFQITWTLLEIGYKSDTVFADQLTAADIINYATNKLSEIDDPDIVELACEYDTNSDDIRKYLLKLASSENSKYDNELKKWMVIYVHTHLPQENVNHIQGLIELGDIWANLNYPQNSPHVFQGRYNDITPEGYYTPQNYKALLKRHYDWINDEIKQIIDNS